MIHRRVDGRRTISRVCRRAGDGGQHRRCANAITHGYADKSSQANRSNDGCTMPCHAVPYRASATPRNRVTPVVPGAPLLSGTPLPSEGRVRCSESHTFLESSNSSDLSLRVNRRPRVLFLIYSLAGENKGLLQYRILNTKH